MRVLQHERVPFLVGGAFALRIHTGIVRDTKDFDLMLRAEDLPMALKAFHRAGFRAGIVFSHWLAKVHWGECFVDVIFNSGNGLCPVDDEWFSYATLESVWECEVSICPPEEMIWQKAFIMERERYDGADVAHLLSSCGPKLDWDRLIRRFGPDWPVLLAHLILFEFIYPKDREVLPRELLQKLIARHQEPSRGEPGLCQGTLLSRSQYLDDVERAGWKDARRHDRCRISDEEIQTWTAAIEEVHRHESG